MRPLLDRFLDKVCPEPNTGCWLWTGEIKGNKGYGRISAGGKRALPLAAHRVSWQVHKGPIPEGLGVLHKCDVRSCVNPEHLFLGTQTDNMRDMVRKGRHRLNARKTQFLLSEDSIAAIKQLSEAGWSGVRLGRAFGLDVEYVYRILRGARWANGLLGS